MDQVSTPPELNLSSDTQIPETPPVLSPIPSSTKTHKQLISILIGITAFALGAAGYFGYQLYKKDTNAPVACTMEAKICPDGSSVGRSGPNCEFTTCPETSKIESSPSPIPTSKLITNFNEINDKTNGFSVQFPKSLVISELSKNPAYYCLDTNKITAQPNTEYPTCPISIMVKKTTTTDYIKTINTDYQLENYTEEVVDINNGAYTQISGVVTTESDIAGKTINQTIIPLDDKKLLIIEFISLKPEITKTMYDQMVNTITTK